MESFIPKRHITRIQELHSSEQWDTVDPGKYYRLRQWVNKENTKIRFAKLNEDLKRKRAEDDVDGANIDHEVPWTTKKFKTVISQVRKKQS